MCIKGSFVCQLVYWDVTSSKVDVFMKVFIFFTDSRRCENRISQHEYNQMITWWKQFLEQFYLGGGCLKVYFFLLVRTKFGVDSKGRERLCSLFNGANFVLIRFIICCVVLNMFMLGVFSVLKNNSQTFENDIFICMTIEFSHNLYKFPFHMSLCKIQRVF